MFQQEGLDLNKLLQYKAEYDTYTKLEFEINSYLRMKVQEAEIAQEQASVTR